MLISIIFHIVAVKKCQKIIKMMVGIPNNLVNIKPIPKPPSILGSGLLKKRGIS